MSKKIDITGHKYGRLTVIKQLNKKRWDKPLWLCKCDCGNTIESIANSLRTGNTGSCGCLHKELLATRSYKHGATLNYESHALYRVWCNMKSRCLNKNNTDYKRYGRRGIKIYPVWVKDYISFRDYVKMLPNFPVDSETVTLKIGFEIDRIDNNGGYWPGNIRWVTRKEQLKNTSRNVMVCINGKHLTFSEAVEKYGKASVSVIHHRIKRGWSLKKAFLTPPRPMKRRG